MKPNINIIGGSGFIGTRLIRKLTSDNKYNLKNIDKNQSKNFPDISNIGDVRYIDQLRSAILEDSVLINLAAEHRDDVRPASLYEEVNVKGAENICTVARERSINKIIFTSTVAVYGFARIGTDESGDIAPFNDYGRTKYEAEQVFKAWQSERPNDRTLVIIRPTVVFGERNRGNVYNLLRQIVSGRFLMIGNGNNRKSMAYVENLSAFIEYCLKFNPGVHVYNFADKPDFTMNELVGIVNKTNGKSELIRFRLPFFAGYSAAKLIDLISFFTGKQFSISSIRVKKFCANSVYNTSIDKTGFLSPFPLLEALDRTIRFEFLEQHDRSDVFFSE
jgi:nucleoside-diphosphate-sugar epimerase